MGWCLQVVVEAGDLLYHPAGIWHQVEAEEDSVSINISLHGQTWADHLASGFRQLLLRDPAFRVLVGGQAGGQGNAEYLQALLAKVKEQAVPQLTVEHLLPECMTAEASMQDVNGHDHEHDDDDDEDEGEEEGGDKEEDEEEEGEDEDDEGMEDLFEEMAEQMDEEEDEEAEAVDVEDFPLPYQEKHALLRLNPLATVVGLHESGGEEEGGRGLWVVNHLYGNEDLSSTVRAVVRVPEALWPAMAAMQAKGATSFTAKDVKAEGEAGARLLGALLFLGALARAGKADT